MLTSEPKEIVVGGNCEVSGVLLSDIVAGMNHHAHTFDSSDEIVGYLSARADKIDLLLLDVEISEEGGLKLLEWIKGEGMVERFPIILVVGSKEVERARQQTGGYGVKWIVTREVAPERIAFLVNRLLFSRGRTERGSVRVPASIPAEVAVVGEEGGAILNISSTGLYLKSATPLSPGTAVRLRFALPGHDVRLDVEGVVVWGKRDKKGNGIFDGVGIRFTGLSPEVQDTLRDYIKHESMKCTSELNVVIDNENPPS
ncbi:MAG: PilZ domain-containing protein [Thermodesulfobacteriota bacterium]